MDTRVYVGYSEQNRVHFFVASTNGQRCLIRSANDTDHGMTLRQIMLMHMLERVAV